MDRVSTDGWNAWGVALGMRVNFLSELDGELVGAQIPEKSPIAYPCKSSSSIDGDHIRSVCQACQNS